MTCQLWLLKLLYELFMKYRGINLLSVVKKMFDKVLIDRVVKSTETEQARKEQCGFREDRSW